MVSGEVRVNRSDATPTGSRAESRQAAEVVEDFAGDALSEVDEDFSAGLSDPDDFSEVEDLSPLDDAVAAAVLPLVRLSVA